MQPTEYIVTFRDAEHVVLASSREEAQEVAIDAIEARQGFTTEIVRIVRVRH